MSKKRPTDIAAVVGVTPSAVSQWSKGRIKSLKAETAFGLEMATGYRASWLVTGKGPKMTIENTEPVSESGRVPVIDWVTAGSWDMVAEPLPVDDVEMVLCPVRHSDLTFALRVRGDSMTTAFGASFPEGSMIFVDPMLRSPVNGQKIIARLEDGGGEHRTTFKVFKEEDGRRWLQPLNPNHEPIRDAFSVVGTVIGGWVE